MAAFVEGAARGQATLLPECLDDWVDECNPVRAVDVFVDALDLREMGFGGFDPAANGRPAYHPSVLLKLGWVIYRQRRASSRKASIEPPSRAFCSSSS